MKTKAQKQEEVKKGEELLKGKDAVLLLDFSNVKTGDLKNLRKELKDAGNPLLVIKKRLLGVILKKEGIEVKKEDAAVPVGAIFASNLEASAAAIYKFFKTLETAKKIDPAGAKKKMLGGYDLKTKSAISKETVLAIGMLPPREILLGQLLGMIAAPIKSLLYVLDQKAKRS